MVTDGLSTKSLMASSGVRVDGNGEGVRVRPFHMGSSSLKLELNAGVAGSSKSESLTMGLAFVG